VRRPGEPLTRSELFDRVWGADHPGVSNVVDVYIGYLRRKIDSPELPTGASRIETVRGIGYRAVAS
jgi:DNA-binding response OmpR family regulator